ncbi:MAG: hypothetical protein ACREPB_14525 [Arenimonas sp.]
MKRLWVPLCLILGFCMLAYSLYLWGGIANTAEVGAIVRERVSTFSFITWSYVSAGYGILNLFGLQEGASQFAHAQVGASFASMQASPLTALDELFRSLPWYSKMAYYGGPFLVLIGAFAQSRKPKGFKTFGSQ